MAIHKCIFLTSPTIELPADDQFLVRALKARNWRVATLDWRCLADVGLASEFAIIRSTWDYHRHLPDFLAQLASFEASAKFLFNSSDLVAWNARKTYLKQLASAGIRTIPSVFVDSLDLNNLSTVIEDFPTDSIIIKPQVGASAEGICRWHRREELATSSKSLTNLQGRPVIFQPFVESVLTEGEVSLIFIDGRFSHAVRKVPVRGEYRVQSDFGGSIELADASLQQRELGEATLACLPAEPLYARIDMVNDDQNALPCLMELELIEPELFFSLSTNAADQLADACLARLGR